LGIGMRAYNPTRRNRNIGTSKSGHGQDNRLTVPDVAKGKHRFYERIENARQVMRTVSGRTINVFVQPTRTDCVHTCTVDDIARLLSYLPVSDWEGIEAVLLRQPRRKEQTLGSVWGRLVYFADFVDTRGHVVYGGPAIIIEALSPTQPIKLGRKLSLAQMAELERLKSDGHTVRSSDNTVETTLDGCRATQLYRTLPHEVGHWLDFLEKVKRPAERVVDEDLSLYLALSDRYDRRPSKEKEQFAHAYADRLRKDLVARQLIPFERQLDRQQIQRDGLLLHDFGLS
jgi:hypothetical protein